MGRIAIYAYGSLLRDPGSLSAYIENRCPLESPWPVEYARSSKRRGGAPTLAIHPSGSVVHGKLLVLGGGLSLQVARDLLREREGKPARSAIQELTLPGYEHVLYCRLEVNIPDADRTPEHLADLAIASVGGAGDRNGIRYLAACISEGIVTPLTELYRVAVLRKTGATTLEAAEDAARGSPP